MSQNSAPKHPSKFKWIILAVVFLVFIGGMVFSYSRSEKAYLKELPKTPSRPSTTGLAPDIELINLSGKKVRLSDFRGKAVLINFWSITCPACLIELKSLESLAEQLSGKPFALLCITNDSRQTIQEFLDRTDLKLPVYFDPSGEAHLRYGVAYLPASFVIDPKGRLVDQIMGAADWSDPSVINYFQELFESTQPKEAEKPPQTESE